MLMNWHTIALPVIIIGVILYHLSQKAIPKTADPFIVLAAAYLLAFCMSVAALLFRGGLRKGVEILRDQDWLPVIVLGLTAVAIELGYLYAYRTGWKISTTGITIGAVTSSVLAIIGVLWFKEEVTLLNAAGIGFCIVGIVFVNMK
jgi:drug/metabolite transporter (DMT)-like permease